MKTEKFGGCVLEAVLQNLDPLRHQHHAAMLMHRVPGVGFRVYFTEASVGQAPLNEHFNMNFFLMLD